MSCTEYRFLKTNFNLKFILILILKLKIQIYLVRRAAIKQKEKLGDRVSNHMRRIYYRVCYRRKLECYKHRNIESETEVFLPICYVPHSWLNGFK